MKLLLTSVFGPYGVDDEYGRKENIMEILHNQVTREQGVFSMRFNQESYGLYLIAENLEIPTVVLDFPSQKRFIREIKKKYDYIGISFIHPNTKKAQRMAELIRQWAPGTKIILGGHGTAARDIEKRIPCDYVCRGEGVRFLRNLLGENGDAPIKHPVRYSSFNRYILGVPITNRMVPEGIILPGVGCVNGCRFCCTTHFFDKEYTPFLESGKDIFDLCLEYEKKMGVTDFFVMDENFFKTEQRARELLALMEAHNKPYSFNIFSSAETIMKVGIDFIQRLGIDFLWIGVESLKEVYKKNKGVDFLNLIKELRKQGVSVLISGILFAEHHTKESIHEDIDYLVGLKPDFVQFMQLCPGPGTSLYNDYKQKGKLLSESEIPLEERHGQHHIWFKHPHFTPDESELYLKNAFKKDYLENGPSILRMAETILQGAIALDAPKNKFMELRRIQRRKTALDFFCMMDALVTHAPNANAKEYAGDVRNRYNNYFGSRPLRVRLYSLALQIMLVKEKIRSKLIQNNMRQPKTRYTIYRLR
ncbi:MAG: radical SAM protein [bacterium]|nr:radical SAM protein [bacterium]